MVLIHERMLSEYGVDAPSLWNFSLNNFIGGGYIEDDPKTRRFADTTNPGVS